MISFFRFAEIIPGTSGDNILLMLQIFLKDLKKIEYLGLVINKSQHDNTKRCLKICMLIELVEHNIGIGILPQFYDNSYTFSVTLISYIRDAIDLLKLDELGNLDLKICLVDHVRNFRNDNARFASAIDIDFGTGTHTHAAMTRQISIANASAATNHAAGREVRTRHVL